MSKIYITIGAGKIQNCYSDLPIDVAIIDIDTLSQIDYANNGEMLDRLDAEELIDVTPF